MMYCATFFFSADSSSSTSDTVGAESPAGAESPVGTESQRRFICRSSTMVPRHQVNLLPVADSPFSPIPPVFAATPSPSSSACHVTHFPTASSFPRRFPTSSRSGFTSESAMPSSAAVVLEVSNFCFNDWFYITTN